MHANAEKKHHSRFGWILMGSHVTYYGATAFGAHAIHGFAAGAVGVLLLIAFFAGWGEE